MFAVRYYTEGVVSTVSISRVYRFFWGIEDLELGVTVQRSQSVVPRVA